MEHLPQALLTKGGFGRIVNIVAEYSHKKRAVLRTALFLCHIVPDYRTFVEDYLKIVEFIEWLKDFYPEKAEFLKNKFTFLVNF